MRYIGKNVGYKMITDMTLMHLMCAKICHDLAAPIGAVAMGLEILSDTPQDEATRDLIHYSAQSTISKLETFRCLTGFAGMQDKPTAIDVQKALHAYWPDNKISVVWKIGGLEKIQGAPARLLLAMILTASDGLPQGGTITIDRNLCIIAEGTMAHLREMTAQAFTGETPLTQQTSGTIVAFFACALATRLGSKLHVQTIDENRFQFIALDTKS